MVDSRIEFSGICKMISSTDELKTVLSVLAFFVSLISLYFTRVNWIQSYRPVVVAFIEAHSSGQTGATLNLVVSNVGSRPAVKIRLDASSNNIDSLFEEGIEQYRIDLIKSCFEPDNEIPLLRNGEDLSNCFGGFGTDKWLKFRQSIEISITYSDLAGRSFKSKQPLKVYERQKGFAGTDWSDYE